MKRVTAPPGGAPDGPFNVDQPEGPWWIDGVIYLDPAAHRAHLAYAARRGLNVEDAPDGAPAEYEQTVAALRRQASRSSVRTSVTRDAADSGRTTYVR